MSRLLICALVCAPLAAAGCGSDSKSDKPSDKAAAGGTPSSGDVVIRDKKNDADGKARDVDLKSVSVLRKKNIVQVRIRPWQKPTGEVVYKIQFAAGEDGSELRVTRPTKGNAGVKTKDGKDIAGGKVIVEPTLVLVQIPQDAVTKHEKFGFRAGAKSADGKSLDE